MGKKSRRRTTTPAQRATPTSTEKPECTCPTCTGTGWVAGRGGSSGSSKKCHKKEKSRIKRAQKRNEPNGTSTGPPSAPEFLKYLLQEGCSPEDSTRYVGYFEYVASRNDFWSQTHHEICGHEGKGEWQIIEDKATEQMQEIEQARASFGIKNDENIHHFYILLYERLCYFNRGQARMCGLNNLQGAVDDFTKALFFARLENGEYGSMKPKDIKILYHRAECLEKLGQLDAACEDLEACSLAIRAIGKDWDGALNFPNEVIKNYLAVMAKKKVKAGATRPLFSASERDKIERNLGMNMYDPENYRCKGCGVTPSPPDVVLKKCGRCMLVWFCSRECQLKAHKSGVHSKIECMKVPHLGMPDEGRAAMDKEFEENQGVTSAVSLNGQPRVFFLDEETGRYYDVLTNDNCFFLPSEGFEMQMEIEQNNLSVLTTVWKGPFVSQDKIASDLSIKEKFLHDYAAATTRLTNLELEWTMRIGNMWHIFSNKTYELVEKQAVGVRKSLIGFLSHDHGSEEQGRELVAVLSMIPLLAVLVNAREQSGKFELASKDATEGLAYIKKFQTMTQDIQSPHRQYGVREKAIMLFRRSQCRKRLLDFQGAQEDLRECIQEIRASGASYDNDDNHPCALIANYKKTLGNALSALKIAMALQKVKEGVPRPHYTDTERRALQQELDLSSDPPVGHHFMKVVNSANMGSTDPWAFETFGVFIVSANGEESAVVRDASDGSHYESLSNSNVLVISPDRVEDVMSALSLVRDAFNKKE